MRLLVDVIRPDVGNHLESRYSVKLRNVVLSCALVFSATACGGSSDDDFMEKSIGMMEGLAKAVESADGDCGKMATNVEAFVNKNEGTMKEMKAQAEEIKKDKSRAEKMAKSAAKYADRMQKAMPAMMGMMKCSDDPKMKAMEGKLKAFM
jgi:hypothetical protein